jgi:esterase/lipase superfamily enzyme
LTDLRSLIEAVQSGHAGVVERQARQLLAGLPATGRGVEAADTIAVSLEAADWLFEHNSPGAGAVLYRTVIDRLKALGAGSPFTTARLLDRLARQLAAAGRWDDAVAALREAIELSYSNDDRDDFGHVWRLKTLAEWETKRGRTTDAEVASAEQRRMEQRAGTHSLNHMGGPFMRPMTVPLPDVPKPRADYRSLADAISSVPDSKSYYRVPVHFATHRKPISTEPKIYDPYDRFGSEAGGELQFGRAVVTVPANRTVGQYEEPSGSLFGNGGAPDKSFTVQSVDILKSQELLDETSGLIDRSDRKELLVFLHGYWTPLASGLMRAAQLKVDMKIDGAVVLYSLPSKGTMLGYAHDRKNAQLVRAHEQLCDFLLLLSAKTGATRFHLLAHSLGCEMLVQALNKIWERDGATPQQRFKEIMFAAPDVDHQQFIDLVPRVTQLCKRVTVYSSKSDIPLYLMGTIVDSDRAGFNAERLAGLPKVEAVDTTAGRSWFRTMWQSWGHWDFSSRSVDDVRAVVWLSLLPVGRKAHLERRTTTAGAAYWAVADAETKLPDIFRMALEWARRLDLAEALRTASRGAEAEASRQPPGERLEEFRALAAELTHFTTSRLE